MAVSSLGSQSFQHSGWIRESIELSSGRVLRTKEWGWVGGEFQNQKGVELLLGRSGAARVLSNRDWYWLEAKKLATIYKLGELFLQFWNT